MARRAAALAGVLILVVGWFAELSRQFAADDAIAPPASPPAAAPSLAGFQGAVARTYTTGRAQLTGTAYLVLAAAAFDTPAAARAAPPAAPQLIAAAAEVTFYDLRPAPAPPLGTGTLAYTGLGRQGRRPFNVAILIRPNGRYLDILVGAGLLAKPLSDLVTIAERVVGTPSRAVATPPTATLWDRLPPGANLPSRFVLDQERELPANVDLVTRTATPLPSGGAG